ncbi:MAG: response regulator [Bacteroidales bacterium]
MDLSGIKNKEECQYLNSIPLPIAQAKILSDAKGKAIDLIIEEFNSLFAIAIGINKPLLAGKRLSSLSSVFESNFPAENLTAYFNKKEQTNFTFEICIDATKQWFDVFVTQISTSKVNLIFHDSSSKFLEMGGIPSNERKFKKLYDNLNVGVYRVNPNGDFIMANTALLNMLGYESSEELSKKNINNERQAIEMEENIQHVLMKEGMLPGFESSWQTKNGNAILAKESARAIHDTKGNLLFFQGMIENISTAKVEEIQIKQLNAIFLEMGIDPKKNMEIIVRKCCEIINGYCSVYINYDKDQNKLIPEAEYNAPEDFLNRDIDKGNVCFDATVKNRGPVIIEDLANTEYYKNDPNIESYGFRTYIGHPVNFNGSVKGSLCIFDLQPRSFTDTEINIVSTLAIALALEHKRLIVENDLKKASTDAKNANKAKSQFLANMSHEIRTPLNGIMGFSELLLSQETDNKKKRMLQLVEESGQHLFRIVNDIFDYSMIEVGKVKYKEVVFNIKTTLQEIIDYYKEIASEKDLSLVVNIDEIENEELHGDVVKLNQVLVNIISNAIKFTDEGSVFILAKTESVGQLVNLSVTVEDSGIGIGKDQLLHIFEEFEQLEYYLTKRIRGTGIGLAITKKLIDFLNGSIIVESEPGKGSRFIINIPFKTKTIQNSEVIMDNSTENNTQINREIKILLAEDNEANQFLIKAITKSQQWNIKVVDDGEKAVSAYKEGDFDIVLMDVQMPTMNGYEATKEIRNYEKENGKHTPIIALTAYAMQSDKDLCIEAGMDDYISKPFKRQQFLDAISATLKKYST